MRGAARVIRLPVLGAGPPRSHLTGEPGSEPPRSHLLDELLAEQQELSAVERFARRSPEGEAGATMYRESLPASPPGPGQQYAFEVDLDLCSGCKACVTACHSLNGLDEGESWRQVGRLHGSVEQTVTAACHHCVDPACLRGCPASAYAKDAATGIVHHLADQCIGCQYCLWTCAYQVPQYSPGRGVVRKCDMCSGRLAAGEAPACVQACPSQAIAIRVVEQAEVPRSGVLLPGAPPSSLSAPSTIYRSREPLPGDLRPIESAPASGSHLPLVALLVLTQLAVGSLLAERAWAHLADTDRLRPLTATVAALAALLGLASSTLHLGRPRQAWRALRGLRTSWLSREVLVLALFVGAAGLHALALSPLAPAWLADRSGPLGLAAGLLGGLGVACSVLVYAVTGRPGWSLARTGLRFLATTAVLGVAVVLAAAAGPLAWTLLALLLVAASLERRAFFVSAGAR